MQEGIDTTVTNNGENTFEVRGSMSMELAVTSAALSSM